MTEPTIWGLATTLGDSCPIDDLPTSELAAHSRELLQQNGQYECRRTEDPFRLIPAAVMSTLDATGVEPKDISRVILATETLDLGLQPARRAAKTRFWQDLAALGLDSVPVTTISFMGCTGAVEAAGIARALVLSDAAEHVLLITGDWVPPGESRLLAPSVSILSDGVATALISRDMMEGYRILSYHAAAFLRAGVHDAQTDRLLGPSVLHLGRSLASLRATLEREDLSATTVLIPNGYGLSTVRMLGRLLGFSDKTLYTAHVGGIGHIGAPDVLVGLQHCVEHGPDADEYLLLGTGPASLASLRLQVPSGSAPASRIE